MKQHDIRLRNRTHVANLYVGTTYQSLSVRLNKRITEMDVYILELPTREDISARDRMVLTAYPALTELSKYISVDTSSSILNTQMGRWVVRTVFEQCSNVAQLDAMLGDVFSSKEVYGIGNDITLTENLVMAIRETYCSCENLLSVFENDGIQAILSGYTGADDVLTIDSVIGGGMAVKAMPVSYCAYLASEVHTAVERLCSLTESIMCMSGSASALMTMYRKLSEVDNDLGGAMQRLSDIDDMSLEDLDYIEL